jgi:hypothetical protein
VFSSGFAHVPDVVGSVKAPVLDPTGKAMRHKENANPLTGQPYAPPVLWIGGWRLGAQRGCTCSLWDTARVVAAYWVPRDHSHCGLFFFCSPTL